jgi:hypothetical protein
MSPEELTIAEASIERLYLPWTYFEEEDQIYSQKDDPEYGEYGSVLSEGKEFITEFLGKHRSMELINAVNIMPQLLAEVKRLRAENSRLEAAYLKEKANWEYRYDSFLNKEGAMQIAKEALERIKASGAVTE